MTQQPTSKPSKQDVQTANWQAVNWPELEARVFRDQRAIHDAFKQGEHEKGHRRQTRLMGSHYAKHLAVRKATEDSNGAGTAGVDGAANLTDSAKWRLATTIRFDMKPSPVRRTFIPKPNKNELRPLGIPTIRDRAIQHLIKLALEPAAEALLAPEQFGFRPGRSCWDAAMHIRLRLRQPTYVLDADISKFFDRIDHDAILRVTPEQIMVTRLNSTIRGWCQYHRPFFAKETFSKLDHLLFGKLWKWSLRKHPSRKRAWVIKRHWNNAKPWRFTVISSKTGKPVHLISAAATPILRHYPVKPEKSWFDGDWAYWAKRAGHYPMLTKGASNALKRQQGKRPQCKQAIVSEDRIVLATLQQVVGPRKCVMHRHCADALRNATTEPAFVESVLTAARCGDDSHAGLTEPSASRVAEGSTANLDAPGGVSGNNCLTGAGSSVPGGIFSL